MLLRVVFLLVCFDCPQVDFSAYIMFQVTSIPFVNYEQVQYFSTLYMTNVLSFTKIPVKECMTVADQIHLCGWTLSQVNLLDNCWTAAMAWFSVDSPGLNVALCFGNMELESRSHGRVRRPFAWLEFKVNYTVEACNLLIWYSSSLTQGFLSVCFVSACLTSLSASNSLPVLPLPPSLYFPCGFCPLLPCSSFFFFSFFPISLLRLNIFCSPAALPPQRWVPCHCRCGVRSATPCRRWRRTMCARTSLRMMTRAGARPTPPPSTSPPSRVPRTARAHVAIAHWTAGMCK